MKQEDKDLLLKDLCARLPYGLYVQDEYGDIVYVDYNDVHFANYFDSILNGIIKPYLFPISTLTEEQRKEYESLCVTKLSDCSDLYDIIFTKEYYDTVESIDYLYKNHIDIRGLIPMGLANNATGKNIY